MRKITWLEGSLFVSFLGAMLSVCVSAWYYNSDMKKLKEENLVLAKENVLLIDTIEQCRTTIEKVDSKIMRSILSPETQMSSWGCWK